MNQKERAQQEEDNSKKAQRGEKEPITSDSIKNAHASGDGSLGRSKSTIQGEEEQSDEKNGPRKGKVPY